MSLYTLKPRFQTVLSGIEIYLVERGVRADWLTASAVAAAATAAILHSLGWGDQWSALWLIPPLALLRLTLNALDGQVARRSGSARPWGAALNELGDRLGDLLFLAPLALVGPVDPRLGLAALCAMLLTSLTGVLAASLGAPRLTTGVFAKADRMVALALLYTLALALAASWPLTLLFWLILVGSMITLAQRIARLRVVTGER